LSQSFHLKATAKQREQACHENDPTFGRMQDIGISSQIRKMPENNDSEQCASKNKTEAT
jgi:hypothetical protein